MYIAQNAANKKQFITAKIVFLTVMLISVMYIEEILVQEGISKWCIFIRKGLK